MQRRNQTIPKTSSDTRPDKDGSERECALSREKRTRAEMIRFVCDPAGRVVPDIAEKLPGRGVWVTATRDAVETAAAKGIFPRRFKAGVSIAPGLAENVEHLLLERCKGLVGFARRSGQLVTGFDQVRASLRKTRPAWLLEASDGAEDGRRKVYSLASALYGKIDIAGALTSAELGMAIGRVRVIHALLLTCPLADSWTVAYGRLKGFRASPEEHWFSAGEI